MQNHVTCSKYIDDKMQDLTEGRFTSSRLTGALASFEAALSNVVISVPVNKADSKGPNLVFLYLETT